MRREGYLAIAALFFDYFHFPNESAKIKIVERMVNRTICDLSGMRKRIRET